jgi:hypothetical protein
MSGSSEKKRAHTPATADVLSSWTVFQMIVVDIEVVDSLVLTDVTRARVSVDVLVKGSRYMAIKDIKTKHAHELMLAFACVKRSESGTPARLAALQSFDHLVHIINRDKMDEVECESSDSDTF